MKALKKGLAFVLCLIALGAIGQSLWGKTDHQIRSRVLKLRGEKGLCSGEQIKAPSGENYILTAAHCLPLAKDGMIEVETEDGRVLPRRVIAEDKLSDLLILEGLPKLEGLNIAAKSLRFQEIRTFTHGRGHDTYETKGVLIDDSRVTIGLYMIQDEEQKIACESAPKYAVFNTIMGDFCVLSVIETATTAFIAPGSSGGAVVDKAGDLVGVVSAGGDGYGYLVTLKDIQKFVANY